MRCGTCATPPWRRRGAPTSPRNWRARWRWRGCIARRWPRPTTHWRWTRTTRRRWTHWRVAYTQADAYAKAAIAFERAAARQPGWAPGHFNLATAQVATGELAAAEHTLETCLGLDPTLWKAHLTLAQLRRQSAVDNHVPRLQALLAGAPADADAALYLNLALAKEYEDLGQFDRAFACLARGKAAGGAGRGYRIERDQALFDALMQAFPEPAPDPAGGDPSPAPIFVIGMPRSGTTVVERILTAHPSVLAAGELQNFGVALKRLSGSRTPLLLDPDTVARARAELNPRALGSAYLASTRPATAASPRFTDNLPHNFLYAGFIARALPHARLLCLRRDPLDTCLGNFRHLFNLDSGSTTIRWTCSTPAATSSSSTA